LDNFSISLSFLLLSVSSTFYEQLKFRPKVPFEAFFLYQFELVFLRHKISAKMLIK
jgi:hypothetical protein